MENNVVTLETAKKLKAAGFPADKITYSWHVHEKEGVGWRDPDLVFLEEVADCLDSQYVGSYVIRHSPAATAQEIADQLPYGIKIIGYHKNAGGWTAIHGEVASVDNDTMAEALAFLYLKLKGGADE